MGYILLPLAILSVTFGMQYLFAQQASNVPGAGIVGLMDTRAAVVARQIEVYGAACESAALASPGTISNALSVTLPDGAATPPQANCMATANPGGGRRVYAYMPGIGGAYGQVAADTQYSASWYRVSTAGQAASLVGAAAITVPATIPVGAITLSIVVNP
ncbi:hypothetical protein AB4Y43_17015 [Paraburkholderia sp. BR10872]|uniref:hypothetical protein n=1 Tax=Paraburkholderia sp. BR10872 TaxID=3236989 RepID=UPI0034D2C571